MKRTGATGPHWHVVLGTGGAPVASGAGATATQPDLFDDAEAARPEGARRAGVAPVELPEVEPGGDLRGEAIDAEWLRFKPESGPPNIPRAATPPPAAARPGATAHFLTP